MSIITWQSLLTFQKVNQLRLKSSKAPSVLHVVHKSYLSYAACFAGLLLNNLLSASFVGRHVSKEVGADLVMVKSPEREHLGQILNKPPDDAINPYPQRQELSRSSKTEQAKVKALGYSVTALCITMHYRAL